MIYPKKCVVCGSTRISVYGFKFHCKKCGYLNEFNFPKEEVRALTQAQKGKEV